MIKNLRQRLVNISEEGYKRFSSSLLPNVDNVLGVRLPILRKIAKEIYKSGCFEEFVKNYDCKYMEETMLQGMVIGLIKSSDWLDYVKLFIPKINNWSVCDSFCSCLKMTLQNKKCVWNFIQPYFKSDEFGKRFAFVMLLTYFIEDEFIDEVFKRIDEFDDKRYYAQMACAWAVSVCFAKYPQKTLNYMKNSKLNSTAYKKSVQKIRESLRVDLKTKEMLKS